MVWNVGGWKSLVSNLSLGLPKESLCTCKTNKQKKTRGTRQPLIEKAKPYPLWGDITNHQPIANAPASIIKKTFTRLQSKPLDLCEWGLMLSHSEPLVSMNILYFCHNRNVKSASWRVVLSRYACVDFPDHLVLTPHWVAVFLLFATLSLLTSASYTGFNAVLCVCAFVWVCVCVCFLVCWLLWVPGIWQAEA